jgi:hypothetical protein
MSKQNEGLLFLLQPAQGGDVEVPRVVIDEVIRKSTCPMVWKTA